MASIRSLAIEFLLAPSPDGLAFAEKAEDRGTGLGIKPTHASYAVDN
jgi:hypothetical protein